MSTHPDYLDTFPDAEFDREAIIALREERQARLFEPRIDRYRTAVESVADVRSDTFDFSSDVVTVGRATDLSGEQPQRWQQALEAFRPWKKGPFDLFGTLIDAEWRSDLKWNRITPHIKPLTGRRVADIGCHNGYFMFRMADQQPACIIGFEPVAKHYWNFQLIQNVVRQEQLTFELLGVEHIDLYPRFFDTIFCLGILYHHPDPLGLLVKLRKALAPGGEIVIDCQGIPGDAPVALTPPGRYARARGIWFLPTQSCLTNWLTRTGFSKQRSIFAAPLSSQEQRRTLWADIDSLSDFLDPTDPTRTIEGHPAPWRYYVVAEG
ncbi:MAG: tRNA 5-methoxyuridine(34)/uridine 5-oxyacetic acid(34) synthase CmoB [Anaerolineae bacterium]|nr:tRNA 5-methoxyuridine(34)/uridine 5-oxyacetic acid(34) synthase CmoB [Anaerolineae bacterium]